MFCPTQSLIGVPTLGESPDSAVSMLNARGYYDLTKFGHTHRYTQSQGFHINANV